MNRHQRAALLLVLALSGAVHAAILLCAGMGMLLAG